MLMGFRGFTQIVPLFRTSFFQARRSIRQKIGFSSHTDLPLTGTLAATSHFDKTACLRDMCAQQRIFILVF
jgi:hypothetical protein